MPDARYVSVHEMRAALSSLCLGPEIGPVGNGPARTFRIPGALGTIGFISPLGDHFCSSCNRLRLTADGKLRPCLGSSEEVSIREALRQGDSLEEYFQQAIARKPQRHEMSLQELPVSERLMSQIGG